MQHRLLFLLGAISLAFVVSGCANRGIVKLSPDTYMSLEESPLWPGKLASVEYQFRVVDKSNPDAQRTNHILQSNDAKTKDQTNRQKDIHAELIKLDDLRKKGIINDAEFEMQKKKILTTD